MRENISFEKCIDRSIDFGDPTSGAWGKIGWWDEKN